MMNRIDDTELKNEIESEMECSQIPTNDMSSVCPQTLTNDMSSVCPQPPTNDTSHKALTIKQERSDDDISNDSMTATTAMLQKVVGRLLVQQSVPAAHGNSSPGNSSPGNCSPGNCSPGNCSLGNSSPGNYDHQCDSLIEVKGEFEGVCEEVTPHIESGEFYTTFTLLKRK